MSHNLETMAWTNEVPWHGLGTRVDDKIRVKDMLKAAKLDWKVEKQPMTIAGTDKPVPGFFALTRDRDGRVLDVVGNRYVPVQNDQAFEFFVDFVEAGGAKMETAGSLRNGEYVWGLANLNASFKLKGNDEVKGYLLVGCPHQQGKSLLIKFTSVRVVCNNTLTLALATKGNEWRMSHRTEFDQVKINEAKDALGIARDQLGEFERNARTLQKLNIKRADAIRILAGVFAPDADVKELVNDFDKNGTPRLQALMAAYVNAPGAQEGNGWGLLNAVTYYADHMASRTADKRLSNAWLGRTAGQKEKVLDKLLQMA
jgi:phage/plasmid-like protein (TIGR03299 family)